MALDPPFSPLRSSSSFSRSEMPAPFENPRLPAVYHDSEHEIHRTKDDILAFVKTDLDVARLNYMHSHLWFVGRPMTARALHRQVAMGREIVLVEQADLHLVWHRARIFIKPLPEYLISHNFWSHHLCSSYDQNLHASARGFLMSYVWLLGHPSDFQIAKSLHLLPGELRWDDWLRFLDSFLERADYMSLRDVNMRYQYGELRLGRLNFVYRLLALLHLDLNRVVLGYQYSSRQYANFFQRNFAWLVTVFIYVTVVLTAMQVGLATGYLQSSSAFQRASWLFSVFATLGPLAAVALIVILFLFLILFHLNHTLRFLRVQNKKRL